MILDATAGNRSIYTYKYSRNIIYLDRQKQLKIKPTIFADDMFLPFKDSVFDMIIFDPPHQWTTKGTTTTPPYSIPQGWKYVKLLGIRGGTYYGAEQYSSKAGLIKYIYNAQKEFKRVLKDDGVLLFKWCEVEMDIKRILALFQEWRELMRLPVKSPTQTMGTHQTYWVMMEKRSDESEPLETYINN
jgi:tRNA G10  N-methylase Trm11